jgi:hypothetical protein
MLWPRAPRPGRDEPQIITGPDKYDAEASARVVGLIDLLFALVLTLPAVTSTGTVRAPWHSNVPAVLALVLGYYVVVRSFIDWHIAMEDAPYWIRTSARRTWELRRVYVDCGIVIAYVMLFLSADSLTTKGSSDIGEYLAVFVAVFVLYLVWGRLRRISYRTQHEFKDPTLVTALVGFLAIWCAYRLDRDSVHWLSRHAELQNVLALLLAYMMYAAYRFRNWKEMRKRRAVALPASVDAGVTPPVQSSRSANAS